MKKLFLIFALMFTFAVISFAQNVTLYMGENQEYVKYTTDVTLTATTPVWYLFKTATDWPTTQHFIVDFDSVSGDHTAVTATLFGRNFDDAAWTSITTTIVDGGVNSAIDITGTNTTETRWRQFKLNLVGTGVGVSTIDKVEFLMLKPD
jgi:hypothetical protein